MLFISFTNYFHNFIFLLSKSTETAIIAAHNKLWYSILLSIALTDFSNIFCFYFRIIISFALFSDKFDVKNEIFLNKMGRNNEISYRRKNFV